MALLPLLLAKALDSSRPSRILNQHFGVGLDTDDLLSPMTLPREVRAILRSPSGYYRPWSTLAARKDTGSTVTVDKDKYQVNLDVKQFAPNEINVSVTGEDTITVEGKHEEKQDEHGYISRHFVRKYILPKGHDIDQVASSLSSDGVLTITAPKVDKEATRSRKIYIKQTGRPLENGDAESEEEPKTKKARKK